MKMFRRLYLSLLKNDTIRNCYSIITLYKISVTPMYFFAFHPLIVYLQNLVSERMSQLIRHYLLY